MGGRVGKHIEISQRLGISGLLQYFKTHCTRLRGTPLVFIIEPVTFKKVFNLCSIRDVH